MFSNKRNNKTRTPSKAENQQGDCHEFLNYEREKQHCDKQTTSFVVVVVVMIRWGAVCCHKEHRTV